MLSISDWVSFLINQKNPNIRITVGFSAFILAVFAIIISVTGNTLIGGISVALVCIIMAIIYFQTIGSYGRRAKAAGKLLDDIMSGKERDSLKIEETRDGNQKLVLVE